LFIKTVVKTLKKEEYHTYNVALVKCTKIILYVF
jgi:hypothetical protein